MRAISYQITVDCADPHAQARFWAAALGYAVEDHSRLVRDMLDRGIAGDTDVVEFEGRLAWRDAAAIRHPDDPPYSPGVPASHRILFLVVPEPKVAKNRWHLDLNVGRAELDVEVARLAALGARELYRVDEPGSFHVTLADPEGNEFCIQ